MVIRIVYVELQPLFYVLYQLIVLTKMQKLGIAYGNVLQMVTFIVDVEQIVMNFVMLLQNVTAILQKLVIVHPWLIVSIMATLVVFAEWPLKLLAVITLIVLILQHRQEFVDQNAVLTKITADVVQLHLLFVDNIKNVLILQQLVSARLLIKQIIYVPEIVKEIASVE